ncbi:MAG TPA: Trm112 family protein [Alloacidobacterium sp.]|nr:Trm112 family protein [Alloacidobacterium sp.]
MMQEPLSPEMLAMLVCPVCHGSLFAEGNQIQCSQCSRKYPIEDGIPILLADRAQREI